MTNIPATAKDAPVLNELHAAAERLATARDTRIRLIREARAEGLTWAAIGEHLGMTGPAAYKLEQRADGGNQ